MGIIELLLLAVGLSMDAFAVSICKGLSMKTLKLNGILIVGIWFGGFQALMPLIGYFLGTAFEQYITTFDHWLAFLLLGIIGANMIREAVSNEEEKTDNSLSVKSMFPMAVATSIDALAVGVTFAFLKIHIIMAVLLIGITTFLLSALGVATGSKFGSKFKSKAEIMGGIILILLGVKILLEHLGILRI